MGCGGVQPDSRQILFRGFRLCPPIKVPDGEVTGDRLAGRLPIDSRRGRGLRIQKNSPLVAPQAWQAWL